jgi:urease accessory protein
VTRPAEKAAEVLLDERPTADRRPCLAIGRQARLELAFERRRGRTVLSHQYAEPPLRVGRIIDVGTAQSVILVCTGPGAFAGDSFRIRIAAGDGTAVFLQSQSALQIHPGPAAQPATLDCEYDVGEGAELYCHWDPVIPFANSRLDQRYGIQLRSTSRLYWSDALMSGRVGRGERWAFSALGHELTLEIDGVLQYAERYSIEPSVAHPARRWVAGSAGYLGTALLVDRDLPPTFADAVQQRLGATVGLAAAFDALDEGLIVGRFAADHGPAFLAAREAAAEMALAAWGQVPAAGFRR